MSKYKSATDSLRAGQLDRLISKIKDKGTTHSSGYNGDRSVCKGQTPAEGKMKIAEAKPAIEFRCSYCGGWNFGPFSLKPDSGGVVCDVVKCEHCRKDNKVVKSQERWMRRGDDENTRY